MEVIVAIMGELDEEYNVGGGLDFVTKYLYP
jgi:hypothetical protein